MSPEHEPTTIAVEQDIPAAGKEQADQLLHEHINQSGTVGQVRSQVQQVLSEVQGDDEAEQRVQEYSSAFDKAASGHETVTLEKMSGGKQGENQVGTHNSKANTDLFEAEHLIEDTEVTEEVLDHEDEEPTGHAGQIQGREGLVADNGEVVQGSELYEGEVESQQAKKHRGNASAAREGQPADVYGSGQQKVAPKLSIYSDYLRKGTDRVEAQAELLKGQNREQIFATLGNSGVYTKEEMLDVARRAA